MKTILLMYTLFFAVACVPVSVPDSDLNLGFERSREGKPWGWYAGGGGKSYPDGYIGELDSVTVHSGKYSLHLKYIKDGHGSGTTVFGTGTTSINVDRVRGKM